MAMSPGSERRRPGAARRTPTGEDHRGKLPGSETCCRPWPRWPTGGRHIARRLPGLSWHGRLAGGPGIPGRCPVLQPLSRSAAIFCRETKDRCALADSSRVRADAAAYHGHRLVAHGTRTPQTRSSARAAQRSSNDLPGLGHNPVKMRLAGKAFGVDLVDVFGARRSCGEPAVLCHDF